MSGAPEEGSVEWIRDIDVVFATAKELNKPVFLLFNEIPGCSTCTHFGQDVLCDPTILELIESSFVAGLVNNRGRSNSDKKALKLFKEPMLNNPVVLFVDGDGRNIIPRRDGIYSAREMKQRMLECLRVAK